MVVVERVERLPPGPTDANQPRRAKQAELMGDGRLGLAHKGRQVTDTALPVAERVNDPDSGGIPEEFENVGDGFDRGHPKQPASNVLDGPLVVSVVNGTRFVGVTGARCGSLGIGHSL